MLGVADGTGAGWMMGGLVISALTMTLQILVGLGKYPAHWPLWATSTKWEQVAAVSLYAAFISFFTIGLIQAS